ncbi:MAG: hypothetical protein ACKVS8_12770 [Phycisphaerales bacterium]
MRPHPRIRKTVKWGGAAVCAALLVVWVGSGWWFLMWSSTGGTIVQIGAGQATVASDMSKYLAPYQPGLEAGRTRASFAYGFDWIAEGLDWEFVFPLWAPFVLFLIPTAIAWCLDARARRAARIGLCAKCGYDRAGLAPGAVCPECGAAATVA